MKKLSLLTFLILSFSFHAQNWCPPGASWIYHKWSTVVGPVDGLAEYSYRKDTLIMGKLCKDIRATFAGVDRTRYFYSPTINYTVDPGYARYFTFEDNRVVYVYNGLGSFDTVVDYNAIAGDSWLAPRNTDCQQRRSYVVRDTSSTVYNGKRLKRINTVYQHTPQYSGDTSGTPIVFVERLNYFSADAVIFEFIPFRCGDPNPSDESPVIDFACYQDDEIGVFNPSGGPCLRGVGISKNKSLSNIQAGPNPFNELIITNAERQCRGILYGADGILVREFETDLNGRYNMDTSSLFPGLYVLQLTWSGIVDYQIKLFKE
jgi:hypothetical protein